MPYSRSPRDGHNAMGWWVMTHARGGPIVIGCVALIVLIADAAYVATQWRGVATWSHYWFIGGLALFALLWGSAKYLGLRDPTGTDRDVARARTRRQQKLLGPVSLIGLVVSFAFGTTAAVAMALGLVAPLMCVFVVSGFREAVNPRHAWQPKA